MNFRYFGQYYQKIMVIFFARSVKTVVEKILEAFTFILYSLISEIFLFKNKLCFRAGGNSQQGVQQRRGGWSEHIPGVRLLPSRVWWTGKTWWPCRTGTSSASSEPWGVCGAGRSARSI